MNESRVPRDWLESAIATTLEAVGLGHEAAATVASLIAEADCRGAASHGTILLPMYVGRLLAGSISSRSAGDVVVDSGAVGVIDAHHILGHLSSVQAMELVLEKAWAHGVGVVAVRNGFHFGQAGPYAEMAAHCGLIGIVAANTRPLMPAPGGTRPVVGNNPLGLAVPGDDRQAAFVVDMALSEVALGRIRVAAAEGRAIPSHWATDAHGEPTTDAHAAIGGMLLPMGGAKGFALAMFLDVLTGVLAGGGFGARVQGLYQDLTVPNDSGHFFMAINPAFFGDRRRFLEDVRTLASEVLDGGGANVRLPGHASRANAVRAVREGVPLTDEVLRQLHQTAAKVGVVLPAQAGVERALRTT